MKCPSATHIRDAHFINMVRFFSMGKEDEQLFIEVSSSSGCVQVCEGVLQADESKK